MPLKSSSFESDGAAECRVSEINVPVSSHHHVVRRVQLFALKAFRHRFHPALAIHPDHAARSQFAKIKPALHIVGQALSAVGVFFGRLRFIARIETIDSALHHIRENKETLARPDQPVGILQPGRYPLRLNVLEILRQTAAPPPRGTGAGVSRMLDLDIVHDALNAADFLSKLLGFRLLPWFLHRCPSK